MLHGLAWLEEDMQDLWPVWGRTETCACFWLGNWREGCYLEYLGRRFEDNIKVGVNEME